MPEILRMPEVAANTTEAILASWNVNLNVLFAAGDPIVTVETDKATVDVDAERDGILLRLLVAEGTVVAVGTPIAVLGAVGESQAAADSLVATLGLPDDSWASAAPALPEVRSVAPPSATAAAADPLASTARVFASPLARKVARESGVDLTGVIGTGPGARIRRRDVDAALAMVSHPTSATAPEPPPERPTLAARRELVCAYQDVPNSRVRQAIARRLTESKQNAPHFYLRGSARVDNLLALRTELTGSGSVKVSVNDLVVKAVARAHVLVPKLNVQWNGDSVRHFAGVDVAVAVATGEGLVTPVVRGVDRLTLGELAQATQDLIQRAHERRLQQGELEGGSITVTNLGMYGTEEFAAIINPPQAAILAVGAARPAPVVEDGQIAVGTVLRVSLAVDHRPVDGAAAAEWMRQFVSLLEHPLQILL